MNKAVMTLHFKEAMTASNGDICLSFIATGGDRYLCNRALNEVVKPLASDKKALSVTITEYKGARSVFQNKMMWRLLRKITIEMTGYDRESDVWDTYCDMLAAQGAKYEDLLAKPEAENALKDIYRALRYCGKVEVDGVIYNQYRCYIGSSKFNVAEMREFIDALFDQLAELGVVDEETAAMEQEWRKSR